MKSQISTLIAQLQKIQKQPDAGQHLYPHGYMLIPGIIKCLELMQNNLLKNPPDIPANKELARGLGRAVSEDFNFSESSLGEMLLKFQSDILSDSLE